MYIHKNWIFRLSWVCLQASFAKTTSKQFGMKGTGPNFTATMQF